MDARKIYKSKTKPKKTRQEGRTIFTIQRVFSSTCNSNFTVISAEGCRFPCHLEVLSSQCEVFSKMLQANWKEYFSMQLQLVDLSTEGVEAFLRYFYLKDVRMPRRKFLIAIELYRISHKYMLDGMTREVRKILLRESRREWYADMELCMELFKLSSLFSDDEILKRVLKILKSLNHTVENDWVVRQLCRTEPEWTGLLFWESFSVCTCLEDPFESLTES